MLNFEDITFRLGPRILFDHASAALPTGAHVGFVGRNGAGKTTLFNMITGDLSPESGAINYPRSMRLGRVEQEAPGGSQKLVDFVLAADVERAALLDEAEHAQDANRIAEIHTRLVDIDAHAAPSRAASILSGLGFDHAAQNRSLSEFSGGWRMRVALAAVLFSNPDLLLLDEPTNYLDLEGTMWLVNYLRTYPATILVISHDRELLDEVADHILHLEVMKLTLWKGNYSSFEQQRREAQAILAKAAKKQDDKRKHLQAFVDRFRASATKARQAQSRLKVLAKMQDIGAIIDTDVLPFHMPSPHKPLAPPMVTMEGASVGYGDEPVLKRLNLSLAPDDRIGLLGSNGNGKSTFAKLIAGRLDAMNGEIRRSSRMQVGFFAQHQIEDLNPLETPYQAISRLMPGEGEAKTRTRCARMGFPNIKADTRIELLSGGEKARLLMGIATFNGPHVLILDEPTNHLDIDSRSALIEAINEYGGAVILVSHDRHLLEACADRLWLVADGTVKAYDGDMDDYRRFVLEQTGAGVPKRLRKAEEAKPPARKEPTKSRRDMGAMRKKLEELEAKIAKFTELLAKVDAVLANPAAYAKGGGQAGSLATQRADLAKALERTEEEWLTLSGEFELAMAG
ncbi:MAG: ATP-binding cassette domain-containing protein [Hyphomicrobiales bacterium]|nr:ATP-binding cassette domain-containing protein [Hyphomicrobiales bacterium]MDE2115881.1 ABC-F family ATP-binding cassette domain-containing protein [Hyphomicrobiales bacterium]